MVHVYMGLRFLLGDNPAPVVDSPSCIPLIHLSFSLAVNSSECAADSF